MKNMNFTTLSRLKISQKLSALWADALNFWGQAWWVEILTAQPNCTYYFGPFANGQEAEIAAPGYISDLEGESAQDIQFHVKRLKPDRLTIDEDAGLHSFSQPAA
jgi:Domain of unknown function (DUF1816)